MSRERLLPDLPTIGPTSLDDWDRCPRLYLDRHVLRLPPSDTGHQTGLGNLVHDLLRLLHDHGDCHDDASVSDLLNAHGLEPRGSVGLMLERHARRCPSPAEHAKHEREVVRRHAKPAPVWIGVGRLDAIWMHDGLLDVRDYKTGGRRAGELSEDPRARMQAWLAAPLAARNGLRIRVRYEYLAPEIDEDPEPFEPEPDDLERIEAEITHEVERIARAAASLDFPGVADPDTCRTCGYRSVCPDSAAPGAPTWPRPPDAEPASA